MSDLKKIPKTNGEKQNHKLPLNIALDGGRIAAFFTNL
jgi:hypothetical protein